MIYFRNVGVTMRVTRTLRLAFLEQRVGGRNGIVHICMMNLTARTQLTFCLRDQCAKAWPQQFELQREAH